MKDHLNLFRVRQWYKNLVIFLAIIFGGKLFDIQSWEALLLGYIALCLISSANYIINDIIDFRKDRLHPEKKNRPLAAGKISLVSAFFWFLILVIGGFYLAYLLSANFFLLALALFFINQMYSFTLKNEPFADLISISTNFVIRAVSGSVLIQLSISPWLVLCTFFLALFLGSAKRHSEVLFLKEKAVEHRSVLRYYPISLTNALMTISASLLILSYSLYSLLGQNKMLMLSMPFALYVIIRYYYLAEIGSPIGRSAELAIKDKRLVLGSLLWVVTAILVVTF